MLLQSVCVYISPAMPHKCPSVVFSASAKIAIRQSEFQPRSYNLSNKDQQDRE